MNAVFLKILNMSLTASLLILAVLPIRLLMKKAPKWTSCLLWLIVAVALVAPVRLESRASVLPTADPIVITSEKPQTNDTLPLYQEEPILIQDIIEQEHSSTKPDYVKIGSTIWCIGMAVLLGYAIFSWLRLKRRVAASIEMGENIYLCDDIDTPFILGIIRPHIYLPSALDEITAQQVLVHEQAHLVRKDHWWKPLGYLLLTLHWFNPLVWVAYTLLCTDIELACDEKVIKNMDTVSKKTYSEALLNCSIPRRMIAVCPLAFGEVSVKQRISAVLHYKKPAFWVIVIAIVVCAALCMGFLTKPIDDESPIKYADLDRYFTLTSDNILQGSLHQYYNYGEKNREIVHSLIDDSSAGLLGYQMVCEYLSAVEVDRIPIAQDALTRSADKMIQLTAADMGNIELCFNLAMSEVWIKNGADYSAVYQVQNPYVLRPIFQNINFSHINYGEVWNLFSETAIGKECEDFSILEPIIPYGTQSNIAILTENNNSSNAYMMQFEVNENGNYDALYVTEGIRSSQTDELHLNVVNGTENMIIWGYLPYCYSSDDANGDELPNIIIETMDHRYYVPVYGPAFVAYLPQNAEILSYNSSDGKPVYVHVSLNQFNAPEDSIAISADTLKTAIESSLNGNSIDYSKANLGEDFQNSNRIYGYAPMYYVTSDGSRYNHAPVNFVLQYKNGSYIMENVETDKPCDAFLLSDEPVLVSVFPDSTSKEANFKVFLNPKTGEILSIASYPVEQGSDIVLPFAIYPDMDESFIGYEALYDAIKTNPELNTEKWTKLVLIGTKSYHDLEYAVIGHTRMPYELCVLLEYQTNPDGTVSILNYDEGRPGASMGNYGYDMNLASFDRSLYWTTFGDLRSATTTDGTETDPTKTVATDYTGFRFIWPDLHQEDYPVEGSFFLAEVDRVIPPAISIPMVGNTALTALGFNLP